MDKKKKNSEAAKRLFLAHKNKRDLENFIVAKIYEHSIYNEKVNEHGGDISEATPESEKTFREMIPASKDSKVTNLKIKKTWLAAYLKERYSQRLATKMSALFDWGNTYLRFADFHV